MKASIPTARIGKDSTESVLFGCQVLFQDGGPITQLEVRVNGFRPSFEENGKPKKVARGVLKEVQGKPVMGQEFVDAGEMIRWSQKIINGGTPSYIARVYFYEMFPEMFELLVAHYGDKLDIRKVSVATNEGYARGDRIAPPDVAPALEMRGTTKLRGATVEVVS